MFYLLDEYSFLLLYKSFVRPILEYGNICWGPHFQSDIIALESVQRRATKLVRNIKELPYIQRLQHLQLPSLSYRRYRGDMITTYKILNNLIAIDPKDFFEFSPMQSTRGHEQKLYKHLSKSFLRRNFFSNRIINSWNSLPPYVIKSTTLISFKNNLDLHLSDSYYKSCINS